MTKGLSSSILDAIGDTPMLEVEGIYSKLEYLNPSGSIKARIAKYMVERAEGERNVEEHRIWFGPEMLSQLPERVVPDAVVLGVGTGGSLLGVRQACREV